MLRACALIAAAGLSVVLAHATPPKPRQQKSSITCKPGDSAHRCKAACASGAQESCAVLGIMHLRGEAGGKPDLSTARRLLKAACRARVALGCGGLGSLYMLRKLPRKARPMFEKGCKMGDALACESLGGMTVGAGMGPGGRDTAPTGASDLNARTRRAAPYYRRACQLGSGTGCAFVAAFIADGIVRGTAREALDLYVKACGRGVGMACRHAVDLLKKPKAKKLAATLDVPRLSADLLKRGCKFGDAKSCARTKATR